MSRYQDTRPAYAPLADGDTILAPGQTEPLAMLIAGGRKVRVHAPKPRDERKAA